MQQLERWHSVRPRLANAPGSLIGRPIDHPRHIGSSTVAGPTTRTADPSRTRAAAEPLQRLLLVGTYPPTECGLATYTANVRAALADRIDRVEVVRLVDARDRPTDAPEVVAEWLRGDDRAVGHALRATVGADAVLLQHEFGIYPGPDGAEVVDFVERCAVPVFTELHTVLERPTERQRSIVERLGGWSRLIIVHSAVAQARLLSTHDIDPGRVAIVPHGATLNLGPGAEPRPERFEPMLLTWGLLGPGKGIEHGIEAVALLRAKGTDVRYVIAGETHPNVLAREGERYRDQLTALAARCGVADLVEFDDAYRGWDALRALVRSATVVLLPYDSREQVTSGVLVEALASGRPVVATAFPHAVELSTTGAVAVVPHGSPLACADAIGRIVTDDGLRGRMEAAARRVGADHDWPIIGARLHGVMASELSVARQGFGPAGW
jgi:glycosyltransferase involved in cell wall biosynthesis